MTFRYLKDPLFLVCVGVYFINRLVIKPWFPNEFSRSYLNDLICIPFWIPVMLFIMRRIGLRRTDEPPRTHEIVLPLLIWSWVFEIYLPSTNFFGSLATSDSFDVLAYTAGALLAGLFWRFYYGNGAEVSFLTRPPFRRHNTSAPPGKSSAPVPGSGTTQFSSNRRE